MLTVPDEPAAMSTTSNEPLLIRSWMSAPLGQTVIRWVTGLAPHHRSLATRTTAPSDRTESSLYGPDDGNRFTSTPGLRSQVVFQVCAIRSTVGPSLFWIAAVTSVPSSSAITCDGIIVVAENSCA
jgi:hypothetical protein